MALIKRAPFTPRRAAALGFVVTLLIIAGWLHFTGAAATRGLERKDMDWNNDGSVTLREMLQSFYAVVVETQRTGQRECRTFRWRGGDSIRVDCRTTVAPQEPAPAK